MTRGHKILEPIKPPKTRRIPLLEQGRGRTHDLRRHHQPYEEVGADHTDPLAQRLDVILTMRYSVVTLSSLIKRPRKSHNISSELLHKIT